MADVALVTGISEEKIIEIKETEILDPVKTFIEKWGWLPDLFRSIVGKAKERKALTAKIEETEQSLKQKFDQFPDILKTERYPDVQAFMGTFRQMEAVVEQYHHDLAQWERQTG